VRVLRSVLRIRPRSRFGSTMGTRIIELCVSVVRKREIWEAGLHCTSLRKGGVGKDGVRVEQESMEISNSARAKKKV
jgi:hypothetical protein